MIDSLNLLAIQAGLVATPLEEQAARAARDLCTEQEIMRIGDPLPLVFCRRTGDLGGVLVSPPATEARFENNASNVLTASWHLVVSEGPIDPIEVRDVFQCACRVGAASQTFSKRAGSWQPGNATVDRGGSYTRWEVPRFCGSPGTYDDLHTMSFVNTYADGEEWNRQVHTFIRGGRHVTRLVDGVTGPSCNVVDLYLLFLRQVEQIPDNLIDLSSLRHAALFTEGLGMRFDGQFSRDKTQNLDDWCENILKPYFLLTRTRVDGREGLMPLLPTNRDGSIFTGRVGPHATLTHLDLDLSSWDLQFLSLTDRRPIRAQMMWRQQSDGIDSIIRTTEVHFPPPYDAPDGPFEQHDLSEFACSERHIAKAGAYDVAHRAMVHHTLRVNAIPGDYNRTIGDGFIVRVIVPRETATHDYLYRVVSIEKSLDGETTFNLVHFPIDSQGRSAVGMAVVGAQPSGLLLPIAKTGPACDVNSSSDTTDLPDDSIPWDLPSDDYYDVVLDTPLSGPDGPLIDSPFDPPSPPGPPAPPDPPIPPMPPGPEPPSDPGPPGLPPSGPNEGQPNPDQPPPAIPPGPGVPSDPGGGGPWGPLGPPGPGMQLYDIRWEAQVDSYSTAYTDQNGKVVRAASSQTPLLDWTDYYIEQVNTWVFFQTVSQNYSYSPAYQVNKIATPVGILGVNYNEKQLQDPESSVRSAFNGYKLKPGGSYQSGGDTSGPTFENGTNVYFARIRNFQIRPSGTNDWGPAEPGPGVDGDTA